MTPSRTRRRIRSRRPEHYAVVVACVSSDAFVAEASATANGAKIVRYLAVCRSTNGGATRSRSLYRLSLPVTGLTLGKTYRCYAYAVNRVGLGKPSNVSGLFRPLP